MAKRGCAVRSISKTDRPVRRAIIASSNYVEGARDLPAMRLQLLPENGPFTVIGNITSGQILINGAPLPAPWAPLNVVAS